MMTFSENSSAGECHNDIQRKSQKRQNVILTLAQNGVAGLRYYDMRGNSGKWQALFCHRAKIGKMGKCHLKTHASKIRAANKNMK